MRKWDFYRNWYGAVCCLAVIMALTGCSGSNGTQENQASGASDMGNVTDSQQIVGQEAGNQQAMGQEAGNQQVIGQEIGNQTQQTMEAETDNQQTEIGQNKIEQNMGNQQVPDLGYHHNDEPIAGHHSSGNVTAQDTQNPPAMQNGNAASGAVSSGNNGIDLESAKSIALQNAGVDAGSAAFTKAELDYDDGIAEYEIEFVVGSTKYEYEINAANGTVLKVSQEAVEQISGGATLQTSISLDEAKAIALNYAQFTADQVVYTKSELDYDDGRAEYEIEFYVGGKEYSFTIDAASGTILEMEID